MSSPRVAAVILNWNQPELTEAAALSVANELDRIFVVDNGSEKPVQSRLRKFCADHEFDFIEVSCNLGYAAGNNIGLGRALYERCDAILVMNNDAVATSGAVRRLVRVLFNDDAIGAVCPLVVAADGDYVLHGACSLDWRTGRTGWIGHGERATGASSDPVSTDYVSGEAVLLRAELLRDCGLFDERFVAYFEDVDLSVRAASAGWKLQVAPEAVFRHMVGGSGASIRGSFFRARNRVLLLNWSLGRSLASSSVIAGGGVFLDILRHIRRGRWRTAVQGSLLGWAAGIQEARRG
jgi:GT2 family glycosyltransferase